MPLQTVQIVIDSREQRPFAFPGASVSGLSTGDYSVLGLENTLAIERKAPGDLLACIGGQRDRFERELARLKELQFAALVVEATFVDILAGGRTDLHPSAILGTLVAWSWRYRLPIWFAGNRSAAELLTYRLLVKAAEYSNAAT